MTQYLIFYDHPKDGVRRCLTKQDNVVKATKTLSNVSPLSYKEREHYKSVLQNSGCKNISVQEVKELQFA